MSNTTIQLKFSTEAGNTPVELANGELAINSADGRLFYARPDGTVVNFTTTALAEPSGLDGELQFNDSGILGASANLIFDKTNGELTTQIVNVASYIRFSDGTTQNTAATESSANTNQLINGSETVTLNTDGTLDIRQNSTLFNDEKEYTSSNNNQVLDVFDKTKYGSAKYFIQAISGQNIHSTEVSLIHDGNQVYISEYGTIFNTQQLISVSAEVDSSNVTVLVAPVNDNTKVNYHRLSLVTSMIYYPIGDMGLVTQSVISMFDFGYVSDATVDEFDYGNL